MGSAPAWDGTGCEFDSWQCRIYIPCSLSLRLLGTLRGSLGTYGLTQKLCWKKKLVKWKHYLLVFVIIIFFNSIWSSEWMKNLAIASSLFIYMTLWTLLTSVASMGLSQFLLSVSFPRLWKLFQCLPVRELKILTKLRCKISILGLYLAAVRSNRPAIRWITFRARSLVHFGGVGTLAWKR